MSNSLLKSGLKIALFNDTGNRPHVGCLAVADAHNRMLESQGIRVKYRFFWNECKNFWMGDSDVSLAGVLHSPLAQKIAAVDAVVVNGEGTIHHSRGGHLLTILTAAQSLGVPTYLINAVFQASETHLPILRRLDDFTVRDAYSSRYLKSLEVPHRLVLDSVLEAQFSNKPDSDFAGKVIITDHHRNSKGNVGNLLRQLSDQLGHEAIYYPLRDPKRRKDWRCAVANFSSARLVVTGRHHGVYLAGLAGVPFVPFSSNTWKIEGLLAMFNKRVRVCTNVSTLRKRCQDACLNQNLFKEFHHFLIEHRPLSTFKNLKR